jgi:molybdopterin-guanine dinucleotide biosynthesis protein A
MTFSGAVLTGGRSSRMGRDKATLEVDGAPLAARGLAALRDAGAAQVLAVGGDLAALAAMGFETVADDYPGAGPLGGLLTALLAASHDPVVVVACDLPDLEPAAVTAVLDALAPGVDAVVPTAAGHPQPLLAAYRRGCRPALDAAFAAGERSVVGALGALVVARPDLDAAWCRGLDSPADLVARSAADRR